MALLYLSILVHKVLPELHIASESLGRAGVYALGEIREGGVHLCSCGKAIVHVG